MARIDVTKKIIGLDGEPMKDRSPGGKEKELTLCAVCENALLGTSPKEQLAAEEKVARYSLAMKIHEHDAVDLTAEEIAKVKKIVGDVYGPMVVGRAWEMLDPKAPEGSTSSGEQVAEETPAE